MLRRLLSASRHRLANLALAIAITAGLVSTSAMPVFAAGGQTGNLNGSVINADTGKPIAGATVDAVSPTGSYKVVTDANGRFGIVGMIVDTYTLSVEAQGFKAGTLTGITISGDGQVSLQPFRLVSTGSVPRTIGGVVSHAQNDSAYVPGQTQDTIQISGPRILQTTGKAAASNENDLVLAVPGVTLSDAGNPTIRGGLRTEVGYQLDGVNYTEPFFAENASNGKFNGIGSLQVVEGAGDATQGNVGAGIINLVPKRGTSPSFGFLDFEAGSPNYFHQFAFEYGFATDNGKISNYIAYQGQRYNPYNGYSNADTSSYSNYYNVGYATDDDLLDNFIFKFGANNSQSLQILYQTRNLQQYGNAGGVVSTGTNPTSWYITDPTSTIGQFVNETICGTPTCPASGPTYAKLIGVNPYVPATGGTLTNPEIIGANPTRFLKFEYDNNLNSTTFLQARYYNWETLQTGANQSGSYYITGGSLGLGAYGTINTVGGPRTGETIDITHQFNARNTVTVSGLYEASHPIWNGYDPNALAFLLGATGQIADFLPGGYLSQYFGSNIPRIPVSGINYNQAVYLQYGAGLRWQFNPIDRLKFDLGVREDIQLQKYGANPFNPDLSNPSDVNPASITAKYINPKETEPRIAAAYQMGPNDALRASYGRSVVFLTGQTSGTPAGMYGYAPFLNVPATDTVANPACGSGTNPKGLFKCANYAQQLFWLYDQNFDAPDLGGALPAVYNNYDFTYQHQFSNGYGMRLTPFYRGGTNLPAFALVSGLSAGSFVFTVNNQGISKASGVEFGLTSPDKAVGFSGFLSATYQNVLQSTPPLGSGEDSLPVNGSGSLILGDTYRAGYLSPFSLRIGGEYKTKNGFRINPILQFDNGYPYALGTTIASSCANAAGNFANIPQNNIATGCGFYGGPGITPVPGFQDNGGPSVSTQYYDPAYSGTAVNPNISATRGTAATSSTGGVLYRKNLSADLVLEYTHAHSTFGVSFVNLFGNSYNGAVPVLNPYYQPVATGLSGPQTGLNPNTAFGPNRGYANVPKDAYAFTNGAYLLLPQAPMQFTLYYQLGL